VAGLEIAFLSACVILGIRRPLFVELKSRILLGLGLVVPIPICALICNAKKKAISVKILFFIVYFLDYKDDY
jgi:hypothetical protein